ncbi:MAG: AAA family ATPase [Negativicutes bacterium]
MSNAYEKLKIREYVRNLMRSEAGNKLVMETLIDWAEDKSELLGFPAAEMEYVCKSSSTEAKKQQQFLIQTAVGLSGHSRRKPVLGHIEKVLREIGLLFRLSSVEQGIFGLFVRVQQYEYFSDLVNQIVISRRRSRYGQLNFFETITAFTGLNPREIAAALKPQEKLISCGLVEFPKSTIHLEVPDKIGDLFNGGGHFYTQIELKEQLIGRCQTSSLAWEDFAHLGKARDLIENLLTGAIKSGCKGINILLHGKPGVGKTEFCRTLTHQLGLSLYSVSEQDEAGNEPSRTDRLQGLRAMQEVLAEETTACIMFDEAEDIFSSRQGFSESAPSKVYMNRQLERNPHPVFWLTNDATSMDKAFLRRMTYCLEFGELPLSVRMTMSQKECENKKLSVSPADLQQFVREYDLPPAVFSNAVTVATLACGGFDEVRTVVASSEKLLGVKRNSANSPSQFDLFLINADTDLVQVTAAILRGGRRDFSFCLSGPPGTGKSEFARWLALQLDMDVLLKRASDLISKWVGETEKNIAAAFQEAETQGKMLIFDEADSFLYSRREAQRSWEVAHVNEMLTWMERHPLPFICTTNLSEKIDEAAFRRFTFKTKFDYLKRDQVTSAFHCFFGQECPGNALALDSLTPGDFAVVKKKMEYFGGASAEEIGQMLKLEMLAKPVRLNSRRVGFKAG